MNIELLKDYIEELREKVDIVALAAMVNIKVDTKKRGKYVYGLEHDSLMLDVQWKSYKWWSMNKQGDFLNLLMDFGKYDFWQSLEIASKQAGMTIPREIVKFGGDAAAVASFRTRRELLDVVTHWAAKKLTATPEALAYATGRGFSMDGTVDDTGKDTPGTVKLARLGFTGGTAKDRDDLVGELSMNGYDLRDPLVVEFVGLRGGVQVWCKERAVEAQSNWLEKDRIWGVVEFPMLLYPHFRNGKVVYLSGRQVMWQDERIISNPDKKHKSLNLHEAFWGGKQLFYNQVWDESCEVFFVVEGPADALTLGQWGLAAVALCGVCGGDELKHLIKKAKEREATIYAALDSDGPGKRARELILAQAGPLTYVITWPEKDANDWLQAMIAKGIEGKEQNSQVNSLLRDALTYVETFCQAAEMMEGAVKVKAIAAALDLVGKIPADYISQFSKRIGPYLEMSAGKVESEWKKKQSKKKAADDGEDSDEDSPSVREVYYGGYLHEHLVDLVYDEERQAVRFAVRYPSGKFDVVPHLDLKGIRYFPGDADVAITKGALLLPKILGPELDEVQLVKKIDKFIYDYYDFGGDRFYPRVSAYYVMLSWLADVFTKGTMIPYLRAMGDYGTGKTRLIWTIGVLCRRPLLVNGGSKPAAIRRMIDKWHPTMVVDEADFKGSDEASDMMKIYNGGNQVGNPIIITGKDSGGGFQVEIYDVYGPKLIAARKEAFDKAFGSRCLTYETVGGEMREDIPIGFPPEFWTRATEIRGHLLAYRMRHWQPETAVDYSHVDRSLPNRLNQVITPLRAIIRDQTLFDEMNEFVKKYAEHATSDRYLSFTARVLEGIVRAWAWGPINGGTIEDISRVYLKDVAACVNDIIDEMNKKMGDDWEAPTSDEGKSKKESGKVTSRKVSDNMTKYLNLHTLRSTAGPTAYRGTMYLEWEEKRMRSLCTRWGVEYLERGSIKRPMFVNLNDDATRKSFQEQRDKWNALKEQETPVPPADATPEDISWLSQQGWDKV
jgi:DNA primase